MMYDGSHIGSNAVSPGGSTLLGSELGNNTGKKSLYSKYIMRGNYLLTNNKRKPV